MAQSFGDMLCSLSSGLKIHEIDTGQRPGLSRSADRLNAAQRRAIWVENLPSSKRFAGLFRVDHGRGSFLALAAFLRAAMARGCSQSGA